MAHHQERGARRRDRERRHGHASSRGRARSSPVVRPAAPAAVRRSLARRQEGARSARPAQSRRVDRSGMIRKVGTAEGSSRTPHRIASQKRMRPRRTTTRASRAIDILLLHYTGMQTADEALARLKDREAKVSCHYFVDEDGRVTQIVPEARRAWHGGAGSWKGAIDINSRSIGIEIVNPGTRVRLSRFSRRPDRRRHRALPRHHQAPPASRANACSGTPMSRRRARRIRARNSPGRSLPPPASVSGSIRRRSSKAGLFRRMTAVRRSRICRNS